MPIPSSARIARRWVRTSSPQAFEAFRRSLIALREAIAQGDRYAIGYAMSDFKRDGGRVTNLIVETKAIPPKKAKGIEMVTRIFEVMGKFPKDIPKWFDKNRKRFDLVMLAATWPERSADDGISHVGPFTVHNVVGATGKTLDHAIKIIELAVRHSSKTGLPGFQAMFRGDLMLVGQVGRKQWAAWYMPAKDTIYLRPNVRGMTAQVAARHLVHEVGHRYWDKKLSGALKRAWSQHHKTMDADGDTVVPKKGEILDFKVDNKIVRFDEIKGGRAVLFDVKGNKPLGTVDMMKLIEWNTGHARTKRFPSVYAAKNAEEHFCETLAHKAMGTLSADHLEAFNRIVLGE